MLILIFINIVIIIWIYLKYYNLPKNGNSTKEKIEIITDDENIQEKIVDKLTLKQLIEKLNFREKEIC